MMASCAYLINDLLDLRADRVHPRKRSRAFASGALQIVDGVFLSTALFVLSVGLSITLAPLQFTFILFFYFVCTLAYSSWLKRKLIIDILVLAGLYTTRIVAGATITSIVLSPWLLVFSMFIFLSLAAVKRQAELTDLAKEQRSKTAGRAYETDDLPVVREIAIAAGFGAVLVFALYISSSDVSQLYSKPELLWLICPLLIYWTTRMVMMTHRGFMDDDPIVFAARDKISFATALLIGLLVFLSI
jgi:4-hydroxybenzoate polyprenyltransferase